MNDLPAVVAWKIAAALAVIVGALWLGLRRVPGPSAPGWPWRAMTWIAAAALVGPFIVVVIILILGMIANWREVVAGPGQYLARMIGAFFYLGLWYLVVSLAFLAPPYAPVLLLWARIGPLLGSLETTRYGLAISAGLLALPSALVAALSYGLMDAPFGYEGPQLLRFSGLILGCVAVSLLIPRLLIPGLGAGTFARRRDDTSFADLV